MKKIRGKLIVEYNGKTYTFKSLKACGEVFGISPQAVYNWVHNKAKPSLPNIKVYFEEIDIDENLKNCIENGEAEEI